jgi:biopolymer transport protein ExbB
MFTLTPVIDLFHAAGWLMLPISLCSAATLTIVLERFWALRTRAIMPGDLVEHIWRLHLNGELTDARLAALRSDSALGRMLAAGLVNRDHSREIMKESIQDTGRQVVAEMERYLDMLGTIASVAPLLGLLGTVIGMIDVFSVIVEAGVGDPSVLAGGISKALLTTAAGLSVAIPALLFHRYFNSRVSRLAIGMEEQSLRLVEVMKGEREPEDGGMPV